MISFDKKALKGSIFLFMAALFWGSAFVAQKICEDYPFSTNCLRFLFGALFMIPIMLIFDRINIKNGKKKEDIKIEKKNAIKGALICGIALSFASSFQQLGMFFGASAGKSGFLTAIYMVIIPILGLFLHKKVGINVWISVILAFSGVALMSIKDDFTIGVGDLITLVCAFCYAIQVLLVDRYIGGADSLIFSFVQLLTAGIICGIALLIVNITNYEVLTWEVFKFIIIPVLYIAVLSCCVAYTCQVIGQKNTPPATASVIMSLESVFSLVFSLIFGGVLGRLFNVDLSENLTVRIVCGIVLVFIAVMLSQFNPFNKRQKKEENK